MSSSSSNIINSKVTNKSNTLYDDYLAKVKGNSCALQYVPDEFKTRKMCLAAVNHNSYVLEYVPDEFKTRELCFIMVNINGWALRYVLIELKEDIISLIYE